MFDIFRWFWLVYFILPGIFCFKAALIYNVYFKDQIDLSNLNNITRFNVKWNLIELKNTETLNEITSACTEKDYDIYFLFTSSFEPWLSFSNNLVLKYGNSLEKMESSHPYDVCIQFFTPSLRQTITYLIYSIFKLRVSIVTDNSACAKQFYKSLVESIERNVQHFLLHVQLNHVIYAPETSNNLQSNQLYTVKTSGTQVVVSLAPPQLNVQIFQNAVHFGLLGTDPMWMIPDFNEDDYAVIPARILSFTVDRKYKSEMYSNTVQMISAAFEIYDEQTNQSKKKNHSSSLDELATRIYKNAQEIEESKHFTDLTINLRHRNIATSPHWTTEKAKIVGQEFKLMDRNLSFLETFSVSTEKRYRLRAVTIIDEPFTIEDVSFYDPYQNKCSTGYRCIKYEKDGVTEIITCCFGFAMDIFDLVLNDIGLDADIYVVKDGKYGSINEKGEWNGLVNDILQGKADIAVAGLTITETRQKYINFTLPFLEAEMGIIVKPIKKSLDFVNFEFISPLSGELQLILWIVIVGSMVLNYLFENTLYVSSLISTGFKTQAYYTTFESMTYISGVTLQRDLGGLNPKRAGARVSAIVFAFAMVIVVTTYTAVLAAQSVQDLEENPFKGSRDKRMRDPTSDFRFAMLKSSSYDTFFKKSQVETYRRMYNFMQPYNVETTSEGINKVKNGSLEAYLGDYQFLYWYVSNDQSCELKVQKDPLMMSGYGFAVNKNLQHTQNINQAVIKYSGSYELNVIYNKWISNACQNSNNPKLAQLGINNFGGLFLLLCATIILCFPLLIPEHWYFRYFRERITTGIRSMFGKSEEEKTEISNANECLAAVLEGGRERSYSVVEAIRKRAEALTKFD